MVKLNVMNLQRFFDEVNQCVGPIVIEAPDGQQADLRKNSFLQYVIDSTHQPEEATPVTVKVEKSDDIRRLLDFAVRDCA